jgi:effector protein HopM1
MNHSPLSALRAVMYPTGPLADVERAQPIESGAVGNTASRQVSHGVNPPLSRQQAQPLSAVEHYERALPQLRELRQAARALAGHASHLPAAEAAKRRMALEGALLAKHPNLDFYQAGELLDMGHTQTLAPRVPDVDVARFTQHIMGLFDEAERVCLPHEEVRAALDEGLSRIARHLEGHEAFFHQALQGALTDTQRSQIDTGHRAFMAVADTWHTTISQLLDTTLALVEARLQAAQVVLAPLQARAPKHYEEAQRVLAAEQDVHKWQALKGHFTALSNGTNPLDKAAQRVQLDAHVAALDSSRTGWFNQFKTGAAEGLAQGIASTLLFVMARAYVDPRLTLFSVVTQSLANGAAMGTVHETLDNVGKPAAREALASLGMRETTEVPVDSLIHDAARATVVDGHYHERTDAEMAAEQALVERARAGFVNSQNDFKTGTLRGDALTYLNQPMAQMIRQLLSVTTRLNTGSVAARAVTSFAGGVGMSFTQALGKMNKTYAHDGRDLPTHVPKAAPEDSLYARLTKVGHKALPTVDLRRSDARENNASKIWSSAEGMLAYNAIGRSMGLLDTSTRSGAAGSVVLANLQAIGLLLPFYANRQSGSEAKADGTDRASSAIANLLEPDRDALAHGTQPGTAARQAENLYNRVRGLTQLAPQTATLLTEAAVGATVRLGGALGAALRRRTDAPAPPVPAVPVPTNPPRLSLGDISSPSGLETALSVLAPSAPLPDKGTVALETPPIAPR